MYKTPWITYNDIHTSDSQIIIQRLNEEFNIDNDHHLTDKQKDISFIFNVAMDDCISLIFIVDTWTMKIIILILIIFSK